MQHLIGIENLSKEDILKILDLADTLRDLFVSNEKELKSLFTKSQFSPYEKLNLWIKHISLSKKKNEFIKTTKGRNIFLMFFEPSTRTRFSFEVAAKILEANVYNFTKNTSSTTKGETLIDTINNINMMAPDLFIIRHSLPGAMYILSKYQSTPIINAGDGYHEHPTQALLDAYTMRYFFGKLSNLKVLIVGDILHSRVAKSNILLLNKFNSKVDICAPLTLVPKGIEQWGVNVFTNLNEIINNYDAVMFLRIQKERGATDNFFNENDYSKFWGLNTNLLKKLKDNVLIMHPGPVNRGVELKSQVISSNNSVILQQVFGGVLVRMAIIYLLLKQNT